MIDGKPVDGVAFDAWRADWPRFLVTFRTKRLKLIRPKTTKAILATSPIRLINRTAGKAKIRIIDSATIFTIFRLILTSKREGGFLALFRKVINNRAAQRFSCFFFLYCF